MPTECNICGKKTPEGSTRIVFRTYKYESPEGFWEEFPPIESCSVAKGPCICKECMQELYKWFADQKAKYKNEP